MLEVHLGQCGLIILLTSYPNFWHFFLIGITAPWHTRLRLADNIIRALLGIGVCSQSLPLVDARNGSEFCRSYRTTSIAHHQTFLRASSSAGYDLPRYSMDKLRNMGCSESSPLRRLSGRVWPRYGQHLPRYPPHCGRFSGIRNDVHGSSPAIIFVK